MLAIVTVLFVLALLFSYPWRFEICWRRGRWRLYWLPHVFAGTARPRRLHVAPARRRDERRPVRLPAVIKKRALRRLPRALCGSLRLERFLIADGIAWRCMVSLNLGKLLYKMVRGRRKR